MKTNSLTIKQEAFCQAYIKSGDASASYREVYSTSKMKDKSIWELSSTMLKNIKVSSRIAELQSAAAKIADEIFEHTITDSLKLDFELIEKYKKHISVLENPNSTEKDIVVAKRTIQFIGINGFNAAQDRVSKKLGFYEKDNKQKGEIVINSPEEREARIKALIEKFNSTK